MFAYSGWDGSIYVNEEVKHRSTNPGRAAVIAVALLAVIYTVAQVGLQGVISPKNLQRARRRWSRSRRRSAAAAGPR